MYYVYIGSQADENRQLGSVSSLAPQTNRAAQDCIFSGTREEVVAWAKREGWSLVWRP